MRLSFPATKKGHTISRVTLFEPVSDFYMTINVSERQIPLKKSGIKKALVIKPYQA